MVNPRRSRSRGIVLIVFPLLLFVFLSTAERFFARWLLPAFPVLALFAGVSLARVSSQLSSRPRLQRAALTALLAAGSRATASRRCAYGRAARTDRHPRDDLGVARPHAAVSDASCPRRARHPHASDPHLACPGLRCSAAQRAPSIRRCTFRALPPPGTHRPLPRNRTLHHRQLRQRTAANRIASFASGRSLLPPPGG